MFIVHNMYKQKINFKFAHSATSLHFCFAGYKTTLHN